MADASNTTYKFTLSGLKQSSGEVLNVVYDSSAPTSPTFGFTITKSDNTDTHYVFVKKTVEAGSDDPPTTTVELVPLSEATTEGYTAFDSADNYPITVDTTKATADANTKSPYVAVTLSDKLLNSEEHTPIIVAKGDGDTNTGDYILRLPTNFTQSTITDLTWTYDEGEKKYTGEYKNVSAGWVALDTNKITYQDAVTDGATLDPITLEGVGEGLFNKTTAADETTTYTLKDEVAEIRGTNIFINSKDDLIATADSNTSLTTTGTKFYVARDLQSATMPKAWSEVKADPTEGIEAGFAYKKEYQTAGLTGTESTTLTNIAEDPTPPTIFTLTGFELPAGETAENVGNYFTVTPGSDTTYTVAVDASALPRFTTETDTVTTFTLKSEGDYIAKFGDLPKKFPAADGEDGEDIPTEAKPKDAATCVEKTTTSEETTIVDEGKYAYTTATYTAYYKRDNDNTEIVCNSPTSAVEYTLEGLKSGIGDKQEAGTDPATPEVPGDGTWSKLITVTPNGTTGTGSDTKPIVNFALEKGALAQEDIKISLADTQNAKYGTPTVSLPSDTDDATKTIDEAVNVTSGVVSYTASGYQDGYLVMSNKPTEPGDEATDEEKAAYAAYTSGIASGHETGAQVYYVGQRGGEQFEIKGLSLDETTIQDITSAADKVAALKTAGIDVGKASSNTVTIIVSNSALTGATTDLILTNVAVTEGTKIEGTATTFDLALDTAEGEGKKVPTLTIDSMADVEGTTPEDYAKAYKDSFERAVKSKLYKDTGTELTTPAELKKATSEGTAGETTGTTGDTAKSANYTYTSKYNNAFYTKLAAYEDASNGDTEKFNELVNKGLMAAKDTVQFKHYAECGLVDKTTFTIEGLNTGLKTENLAEVWDTISEGMRDASNGDTTDTNKAVTVDYTENKVTLSKDALPTLAATDNPLTTNFATVRLSGTGANGFSLDLDKNVDAKGNETIAYTWKEETGTTGTTGTSTYTFTIKGTTAGWVTVDQALKESDYKDDDNVNVGDIVWVAQTGGQQFTISGLQSGLKAKDEHNQDIAADDTDTEIKSLPIKYSVDAEGKYTFYLDDSVVIDATTESEKTAFEALTGESKIEITYNGLVTSATESAPKTITDYTPKYTLDIDGSTTPVTLGDGTQSTIASLTAGSVTAAHWGTVEAAGDDTKVNGFTYISEKSGYAWAPSGATAVEGGESAAYHSVTFTPATGGLSQFSIFGLGETNVAGISAATTFEAASAGGSIVTVDKSVLGTNNDPLNVATYAETPAYQFSFGGLSSYEKEHTVDASLVKDAESNGFRYTTGHTPEQYTIGSSTLEVDGADNVQSYTYQGFKDHYGFTVGGLSLQGGASAVSGQSEINKYFTFNITAGAGSSPSVGTVQFTKQGLSGLTVGGQSIAITDIDANGTNSAPQSGQSEKVDFTLKVAVASGINTEEGRVQTGSEAVLSTLEPADAVSGKSYSYQSAAYDAWYNVGSTSIIYNAPIDAAEQFKLTGMKEGLTAGAITFGGASGTNVVLKAASLDAYNASITDTNNDTLTNAGDYVFELYTTDSETYKSDRDKAISENDTVLAKQKAYEVIDESDVADKEEARKALDAAIQEAGETFDKEHASLVVNTDNKYHGATFETTAEAGKTGDFNLVSGSVDENWQLGGNSTSVTYDGGTGADVFSLTIKNLLNPEHGVIVKDNNKREAKTAYNTHTGGISIFAGEVESGSTVQGNQLLNIAYKAADDESKDLTKGKYTITLYNGALSAIGTDITVFVDDLKQGTATVATPNVEFKFAAGSQSATYIQNTATTSAPNGTYGFTKAYFKEAGYYFAAGASNAGDGFDHSKVVYHNADTEESFSITGLRDDLTFDKAGGSSWFIDANKNGVLDEDEKVALSFKDSVVTVSKDAVVTSGLESGAKINFTSTKAGDSAIFTLQADTTDGSDKFFLASGASAPTGEATLAKFGEDGKEITPGSESAVASMRYNTSHELAYFKAEVKPETDYDTTYTFTPETAFNSITFKGLNGSLSLANFGTTDSDSTKAVYINGNTITLSKDAMPTGGASDSTISVTSFTNIAAGGTSTAVTDYKFALGSGVQTSQGYTENGEPAFKKDGDTFTFSGPEYAEWYQLGSDDQTVNVHASVAATSNTFSITGLSAADSDFANPVVNAGSISFGAISSASYNLNVNETEGVVTVLNKDILPTENNATVTFTSTMNAGGTSAYYTFDFSSQTGVLSEKKGTGVGGTLTIDNDKLLYKDEITNFAWLENTTATDAAAGTTTYTYHTEFKSSDSLHIPYLKTPTDQTPESLAKLIGTEYIVDYDKKTVTIGAELLYTPEEMEDKYSSNFQGGKLTFTKETSPNSQFADYTISFADSLDASMQASALSAAFATVSGEENSFTYTAAQTTAGYSNDDTAKTIVFSQKVGGEPFKITGIRDLTNVTPTVSEDGTTTFANTETVEGETVTTTYLTVKDGTVTLYKGALLDTPTDITFTDTDTKDTVDYNLVFDNSTTDSIATAATTVRSSTINDGTLTYTTNETPLYYTNGGGSKYVYHPGTSGQEIKITGLNTTLTSVNSAQIEFTEGTASGGTSTPVVVTVKSKDILGKGEVAIDETNAIGYSATFSLTSAVTMDNASTPAALTYDKGTTTYTASIGGGNSYSIAADSNGKKLAYTAMQGGETFIVEGVKQGAVLGTDVKVGVATGEGTLKPVNVTLEASALSAAKDIVFTDTPGDGILYTLTLGNGIVTTDAAKKDATITSGITLDDNTTVSSTLKYTSAYSPEYYESVSAAGASSTEYKYHAEIPSTYFTITNLKGMSAAEIAELSTATDIVVTEPTTETVTTEGGASSTQIVPGSIKLGAKVLPVSLDSNTTLTVTSDTYADYALGLMEDDATKAVTSKEIKTTVTADASSAYTFTSPGYGNGYSVKTAGIVYQNQVGGEQFVLKGIKDLSTAKVSTSADGKTITYFATGGTSTAPTTTNYLAYNTDDGKVTLYADALEPGKDIAFTDLNSTLGTYDDVVYTLTLDGIATAPSSVTPGYVSINGGNVYYNTKAAPAYYNNSAGTSAATVAETGETLTTTTYDYIAPATSKVITVSGFDSTGLADGTSTVAVDTTTGTIAGYAGLKITESIPTDDITPVKFEISDPKYLNTVNVVANVGENTLYSAAVAVGGTSIATEVAAIADTWTALNSGKSTYVIDAKEAYYQVGSNSTASVLTYVPSVTGTDALELAGIDIAAWGTNGASAPTIQDGVVTFGYNVGGESGVTVTSNVGYIAAAETPEGGTGTGTGEGTGTGTGEGTSNPAEAEVTRTPYSFNINAAGMKFVGTKNADTITVSAAASVDAGEGNDLITVSGLSAFVDAGAGDDSINVTAAASVLAGEGNDLITVSGLSAFVDAGAGADSINATAAATVNAGEGDDFITIAGAATVDGGTGNDTFKYESGDAVVLLNGSSGKDTINYAAGYKVSVDSTVAPAAYLITNETDDTTTYDVQIVYDNSNILFVKNVQTVKGADESGIATINAVLSNGEAATITASEAEKVAMFTYDSDNIASATAVSLNTSALADADKTKIPFAGNKITPTDYEKDPENPTIVTISAAGIEIAGLAIQGNKLDNVIIGGNQGNSIDGGEGNDTLTGGDGPDTLIGGAGNDVFVVGTGADTIADYNKAGEDKIQLAGLSTFTNITFDGENSVNVILSDGTNSVKILNGAEQEITFTDGTTNVYSSYGIFNKDKTAVTLAAGTSGGFDPNNITIASGTETSLVYPNLKDINSSLVGTSGEIKAISSIGSNLSNEGNTKAMTLTGSTGNDTITAGNGGDVLKGNGGSDTMFGGTGNDTFVFTAGAGDNNKDQLTIKDFATGDGISIEGAASAKASVANGNVIFTAYDDEDSVVGSVVVEGVAKDTVGTTINLTVGSNTSNYTYAYDKISSSDGKEVTLTSAFDGTAVTLGAAETGFAQVTKLDAEATTKLASITASNLGNTIVGNKLDNVISGGDGNDLLTGGDGSDTFIISGGSDTITDYNSKDKISLGAGYISSLSPFAPDSTTTDSGTYTLTFSGKDSNGTLALHVEDKNDAVTIMDSNNPKGQAYKFVDGGMAIGKSITLLGAQSGAVTLGSDALSAYNSLTANVTATVIGHNKNPNNITLNAGGSATGGAGKDVLAATAGGSLTGNAGVDTFVYDGGEVTVTDYGTGGKDKVSLGAGWTITDVTSVSSGEGGYRLTMSKAGVTGTNTLMLDKIDSATQVVLTTTTESVNNKGVTKEKATTSNVFFGIADDIGGYISNDKVVTNAKAVTVTSSNPDFSEVTPNSKGKNVATYSKLVSITSAASGSSSITGNDKNNTIVLTGGGNGSVRGGLGNDTYVIGGAATVANFGIGAKATYNAQDNETGTITLASKITSAEKTNKKTGAITAYAYNADDYSHNAQGKDVIKVDGTVTGVTVNGLDVSTKKAVSEADTFSVTITVDADGDISTNDTYTVNLTDIARQQKVNKSGSKKEGFTYSGANKNADFNDLKAITIWDTSTGKSKKLTWKQAKDGTVTLTNGAKGALANTVDVKASNSNVPTEDLVNDFVSGNDDLGDLMNGSSVGDVGNGLSNSDGTFGSNTTGDAAFTSGSSNNNNNKH